MNFHLMNFSQLKKNCVSFRRKKKINQWKPQFLLLVSFCLSLVLLIGSSCQNLTIKQPPPPAPSSTIAFINGNPIREDELKFRIKLEGQVLGDNVYKESKTFKKLKESVLQNMIQNRVIMDFGKQEGIFLTEEEKALGMGEMKNEYSEKGFEEMIQEKGIPPIKWREIAMEKITVQKVLSETLFQDIEVTAKEIRNYYKKHKESYKVDEQVRVRHLVIDDEKKAETIRQKLLAGEKFLKMAIMHSLSPDRTRGGDLGYFSRGTHPQEFDDVCFKLKKGEISPVVKSAYGYHIFKLIDKKPKRKIPLVEVSKEIKTKLFEEKLKEKFDPWLSDIKSKSQIQIIQENLDQIQPETIDIIPGV